MPTKVTAKDDGGIVYTDRVLVSMQYEDGGEGPTVNKWTRESGSAQHFVTAADGRAITFVTKGSRAHSQNAYNWFLSMPFNFVHSFVL